MELYDCRSGRAPPSTMPKYYRWFIGNLRRVLVDEFRAFYAFDDECER